MKMPFRLSSLPVLCCFLLFGSACSKPIVQLPDPFSPQTQQNQMSQSRRQSLSQDLRVVVLAEGEADSELLESAHQQVVGSIRANLSRHNIEVINTGKQTDTQFEPGVGLTGTPSWSGVDTCEKYGADAVVMVQLEVVALRNPNDNPCRITLSLDSSAHDCRGRGLGALVMQTSVATMKNCSAALGAAAKDLGSKTAGMIARHLVGSSRVEDGQRRIVQVSKCAGSWFERVELSMVRREAALPAPGRQ